MGLDAIADDQYFVVVKERAELSLVHLQLVPRTQHRGILIFGVLQFNDPNAHSVEVDHHIGATFVFVFVKGHLIGDEPVVLVGVVKVHQPHQVATHRTISTNLYGKAIGQPLLELIVDLFQCGVLWIGQSLENMLKGVHWNVGVDASECCLHPTGNPRCTPIRTLVVCMIWGNLTTVQIVVAQFFEPFDGGFF